MIFSLKQEQRINEIVQNLINDTSKNIEWILKEEDRNYINTVDESLTICLGHGELTHLVMGVDYLEESYHYYSKKRQLDYFINIFRLGVNDLRVVVYECNNGQLDGSHKIDSETIEF